MTQVEKMLSDVDNRFTVKTYYGGTNHMREEEWLKRNQPQIVITTPKNLFYPYVLEKRVLKIHTAKVCRL